MLNVNRKYNSIISSLSSGSAKTKAADTESCLGDITQKLQNLLEDTIFKNITLKVCALNYIYAFENNSGPGYHRDTLDS
ncbi:unnamed protein product [Schistosoma mattheei]|uniref:Uncharacterized protein n=1 Tax=Schistosoma mattheei TaxID=31246 RepID=A0A183ND85_9TREM|nr:unnamed protein product [Schistosoma mattheei]